MTVRLRNTALLAVLAVGCWGTPSLAYTAPAAACVPAAAAAGTVVDACALVQPGGRVKNENSAGPCTINFMYRGSDGARYISTAGHCLINKDQVDAQTWKRGHGPVAHDGSGRRIGEYAFWTVHYTSSGPALVSARDMSLIRLDAAVKSVPRLAHFGGPTGMNADITSTPVVMHSVGNGEGPGYLKETDSTVAPARTFIAPAMPNANSQGVIGYAGPGDSGSPVISDDGRAVGLLVGLPHVGPGLSSGAPDVGALQLIRLPQMVSFAERTMHLRLTLMTAPLL